jgi:iron(III) transport system permease protein
MKLSLAQVAADRIAGRAVLAIASLLVVVAILGPVGMVVFAALQTGSPGSPTATWSLSAVAEVYAGPALIGPLASTLLTCIPGTAIAVFLGFALAWTIHRTDAPGRSWLESALLAPVYFSPLSLAVGWVVLAAPRIGLLNVVTGFQLTNVYSITAIILFIGLYYTPYVYLIVSGALRMLDAGYEDASAILGARPLRTLRQVTLPMLRPQILASSLLIFILSLSMFAEPGLFGSRFGFENLPLEVYRTIVNVPANFNRAAAIGTVMLVGAIVGLILYRWALATGERFITTQSRGFFERRVSLGKARPFVAAGVTLYLAVVVVLPVLALIYTSFIRFLNPRPSFALFTFEHYTNAFTNQLVLRAIGNTLILSVGVATITTVFGFLVAYNIVRKGTAGTRLLDAVSILPIGVPAIVLSLGFLWSYLWAPLGIYGTVWALMVALSTVVIPNSVRSLDASLRQLGGDVEFAAQVLGAGIGRRMLHIVLPMLRNTLVSAWLFAFMLTTIQVSVPIVLSTPGQEVLSVAVWTLVTDSGDLGQGSVVALIQGLIAAIVVILARRLSSKEHSHA